MSRRNGKKEVQEKEPKKDRSSRLHPDTKKSVWAIVFFALAVVLALAAFAKAGPLGDMLYGGFQTLFGVGYFILPISLVFAAAVLLFGERDRFVGVTLLGTGLIVLSFLALIELVGQGQGGWLGLVLGSLRIPFGATAAIVINMFILLIGVLIAANIPLKLRLPKKQEKAPIITGVEEKIKNKNMAEESGLEDEGEGEDQITIASHKAPLPAKLKKTPSFANYVPPPLSLLKSANDKPTTGDLLANANVIKRTLDSFGIPVEMGEINIGPAVTRYTLRPAEGMKLSRIEALHKDLALALAAHPIRIEAPIPGKSLVGIEVPNKAAALVRLGSLMSYPEFQASGPLGFALGRDVTGDPLFADIERMPHLLVAGATGSGKSILMHSPIVS